MLNLAGGVVAGGSAAQSSDMTGDLKTGYLLRAKPKNQFIAQLAGSVVAVFLTTGLFILFTKASPCILYPPDDGVCTYGAPSVSAWAAVAVAVTSPKLRTFVLYQRRPFSDPLKSAIPASSGYTAIALGVFSMISLAVKVRYFLSLRSNSGHNAPLSTSSFPRNTGTGFPTGTPWVLPLLYPKCTTLLLWLLDLSSTTFGCCAAQEPSICTCSPSQLVFWQEKV